MISGLITFLSSSAGGAILGFILDYFDRKHEHNLAKEDRRLKSRLAELDAIAEHTKQLDHATPGTLKEVSRTIKLGTWEYSRKTYKLFKTNVFSPRARVIAGCIGMLAFTYCAVLAVFAIEPNYVIWTFQPEPEPVKVNLLIFGFEWPRSTIFELNTGGVAYLMAHPLVFILSTAIVGTARKLGR